MNKGASTGPYRTGGHRKVLSFGKKPPAVALRGLNRPKNNSPDTRLPLFALDIPYWGGPVEGERPVAYITMVTLDKCTPYTGHDIGIAAQTMLLAAAEREFRGCMVGSIKKEELRSVLSLPEQYEIQLVLAFGYPAEQVVLEGVGSDGRTNYWRDHKGVYHVPKRSLSEVLIMTDA